MLYFSLNYTPQKKGKKGKELKDSCVIMLPKWCAKTAWAAHAALGSFGSPGLGMGQWGRGWCLVGSAWCRVLSAHPRPFFFLRNGEIKQGAGHFFSVGRGLLLERGVKKGCLS